MSVMIPDDAPRPRLCHVKKWADFQGYGFNLHAEKGKVSDIFFDPTGSVKVHKLFSLNPTEKQNVSFRSVLLSCCFFMGT